MKKKLFNGSLTIVHQWPDVTPRQRGMVVGDILSLMHSGVLFMTFDMTTTFDFPIDCTYWYCNISTIKSRSLTDECMRVICSSPFGRNLNLWAYISPCRQTLE